ncbi:glutamate 5-kinase [Actinophytocola sp.]|uniref:glutamate 5-kinase n=1 Tax=Actinophytocola sp. TaxID=1872138 RepID=UPI002D3E9E41|nr:glutamate 5-kinase [Actinophytocola sp.]HYQ66130.1 glutamate 5-kinase [Actinophytocola sp.]
MSTNTSPATEMLADGLDSPGDRVVLKIGTSSLITDGGLDADKLDRLCETVHRGLLAGLRPVLLASGAIALGRTEHPALAADDPVALQVSAALGQSRLYSAIQAAFAGRGVRTGQLLLTPPDLVDAERGGGVRHTLEAMLALGIVPVVNENDALGVRNNDVLAALLGGYLQAGLLLLLTNVPGLYDSNPKLSAGARHIEEVPVLTAETERLAGDSVGDGGTGGMRMKLGACWIATFSGVRTVIAESADPDVLVATHRGRLAGTVFHPRAVTGATPGIGTLWRAFRTPPVGTLHCTPAGRAVVTRGETVRHHHVAATHGTLAPGDVVDICDQHGRVLARGPVSRAVEPGGPPTAPVVIGGDYVQIGDHVQITEDPTCQ